MTKTDFKKTLADYQAKAGQFSVIEVPRRKYLMIDGQGDPNSSDNFKQTIEALFPVAYALKFASKIDLDKDYVVMPLEGLWWADDMATFTTRRDKSEWYFTLMIMQPDWITASMFEAAVAKVRQKSAPKLLDQVRLETLDEGQSVQILHIGSFDDEGPVLDRMHYEFMPANNLEFTGKHHEIYFSDFRKVAPEKLKTILRQPVKPTS